MAKEILSESKIISCPICGRDMFLVSSSMKCDKGHTFDISKKGVVCLLKKKPPQNNVYNEKLFIARRNIILKGVYDKIYDTIKAFLIDKFGQSRIHLLDIGCGEGSHAYCLKNRLPNLNIVGVDLAKEGISLASDYLQTGIFSFVGDAFFLPLKEGAFDVILDFLSPISFESSLKVLKKGGFVIKICPTENYLIEIRKALGLDAYAKENEVEKNIKDKANVVLEKTLFYKIDVDKELLYDFVKMTPLSNHKDIDLKNVESIKRITISLKVYFIGRKYYVV